MGVRVKISTREDLHTWESLLHQGPVTILLSVAATKESRKSALPVQLFSGLKEISAIGEQICAFLGNDGATCTQLSNFEEVWLDDSTRGPVESGDECPTLVTTSDVFTEVWKTKRSGIVSECGWLKAHADLRWG